MENNTTAKIRELNDQFRRLPKAVVVTAGIDALGGEAVAEIIYGRVATFNDFTPDNDPYGEHDFGAFDYQGKKIFWKIDYYADDSLTYGSENPASAAATTRVLTVMLASEY